MPWSGIWLTGLRGGGGGGGMTYWLCQAMILIWLIRHVCLLFSFAKPIPIHICCLVNLRISKFSIRNKTYTDCNICRICFSFLIFSAKYMKNGSLVSVLECKWTQLNLVSVHDRYMFFFASKLNKLLYVKQVMQTPIDTSSFNLN